MLLINELHKTKDRTELNLVKNIIENPKAIILVVHGLAEHLGRYEYVVSKLNQFGYSVYRFDNRGHGRSKGEKMYIDDYNKFVDDVDEIVNLIQEENKDKKVFIIGHSMGGMITTLYGIIHPNKVEGIILSAALTLDKGDLIKENINVEPSEMIDNTLSNLICKDKKVVYDYNNDFLVDHKISASMFIECNKAIDYIQENITKFKYPVLILHGYDDKIVYKEDSIRLFEDIGSRCKEIKIYQGMYHEILNEFEKDKVLNDINKWIKA